MTQTQQIADSYRAVTVKGAWYGPTLAELIAKTSPEEAVTPPVPGAHSISTLLQHLLLWNERVRKASDSTPMPRWEAEKEWAEPPIPWTELVASWNQSRDGSKKESGVFPLKTWASRFRGATILTKRCFPASCSIRFIIPAKLPWS